MVSVLGQSASGLQEAMVSVLGQSAPGVQGSMASVLGQSAPWLQWWMVSVLGQSAPGVHGSMASVLGSPVTSLCVHLPPASPYQGGTGNALCEHPSGSRMCKYLRLRELPSTSLGANTFKAPTSGDATTLVTGVGGCFHSFRSSLLEAYRVCNFHQRR